MDNKEQFYSIYQINNNVSLENYEGTKLYVCDTYKVKDNKLVIEKEPYRNQQYAKQQYEFNKEMDNFIFSEDMLIEINNIKEIQLQINKYNKILDELKVSLKELFITEYEKQYNKKVSESILRSLEL